MDDPTAPENMVCFCHQEPLHKCPMFAVPEEAGSGPATPSPVQESEEQAMAGKIHRRKIWKEVRVGIAPEEREPYVKDMVAAQKELDRLELDQADSNATFRKLRKEQEAKREEAMAVLDRGKAENREVEEIKNFNTRTVKYKDIETGHMVEERPMTEEDTQMSVGEDATEDEEDVDKPKTMPKRGKKNQEEQPEA